MLANKAADMNEYFSAMSTGKPLKTYKKTILGRVYVTALDMMTGVPTPTGFILEGDPKRNDPGSMIDIWSEQEDYFFKRTNKRHLDQGVIIEFKRSAEVEKPKTIEQSSDDELKAMINKPFLALQATINKTNSIATLFRIKTLAEELEKSEKVVRAIESRISEVQDAQTPTMPSEIEETL